MGQYTVVAGDTLSGIGAKLGVDWKTITGYKSGNPNLIYPSEVLTYGSNPAPAPTPAQAPAQAPTAQPQNATPAPNSSQALNQELANADKAYQNPVDIYNQALEKLGITDARTRVTQYRQSLIDNQNLLDNLSGNIASRTAGSLVTEAQRQRLYAGEAEPIVNMGNKLNQQFTSAQADVNDITGQAKTTTELTNQGQTAQRQALLDRLKLAIDSETNAETKRQWQAEYDRQVAMDKQNQANWDKEYALSVQQANKPTSSGSGSSGSGSSGSRSGTAPSTNYNYTQSKYGGFSFFADGSPITAMQYVQGKGGNIYDLQNLLSQSKDAGDIKIANEIANGLSVAELTKKYPWVF